MNKFKAKAVASIGAGFFGAAACWAAASIAAPWAIAAIAGFTYYAFFVIWEH